MLKLKSLKEFNAVVFKDSNKLEVDIVDYILSSLYLDRKKVNLIASSNFWEYLNWRFAMTLKIIICCKGKFELSEKNYL